MGQGYTGNVIAELASFFIPGLGQLIQGRVLSALLFFVFCALFYSLSVALVFPIIIAVPLQIWSIVNAAMFSPKK